MEEYFRVGVIANTHGIRGEVKVYPTTEEPDRFKSLKECYIVKKDQFIKVKVSSARYSKNMVILKFDEYGDINEIIGFKGCDLMVSRKDAIPLGPGEAYVADLIGCEVITDDGTFLGMLTDVIPTGANPVYVVSGDMGQEILLPAIPECILDKDVENGKVLVHMMKGLID